MTIANGSAERDIDRLWTMAQQRRRRRRSASVVAGVVAIVVVAAGVLTLGSGGDPESVTVAGEFNDETGGDVSGDIHDEVSETDDEVTGVVQSSAGGLHLRTPATWHADGSGGVFTMVSIDDALTVASDEFEVQRHTECNLPVAAVAAIAPDGAMMAVVEEATSRVADQPRPPAQAMLPVDVIAPDSYLTTRCGMADVAWLETSFVEDDRYFRTFTALGSEASASTRADLLEVIESLTIDTRPR